MKITKIWQKKIPLELKDMILQIERIQWLLNIIDFLKELLWASHGEIME